MGGVEYNDPTSHAFPDGGTPARQYARYTPRFRLPKAFLAFSDRKASGIKDVMPTDSRQTDLASEAMNLDSAESLEHAMTLAFPNSTQSCLRPN